MTAGDARDGTAMLVTLDRSGRAHRWATVDLHGLEIGSGSANGLVLASELVNRQHAVIRVEDDTYVIEDLGSVNGTWLNGELVAGARRLVDGDHLRFADVEAEFRVDRTSERGGYPSQSLPADLRAAPGFSFKALLLAMLGSVVGLALTRALGASSWGTFAGGALGPVMSMTFTTRNAGDIGRVRLVSIVIMSTTALFIMMTGFSAAEHFTGKSVLPGPDGRSRTFPESLQIPIPDDPPRPHPTITIQEPGIRVEPENLRCGTVRVGTNAACPVTISSTGGAPLKITSIEVTSPQNQEFIPGDECVGKTLALGKTCEMSVQFKPVDIDLRKATMIIHQNLPDSGTKIELTGIGEPRQSGTNLVVQVSQSGGLAGNVFSVPSGIRCPSACSAAFTPGAAVTLHADSLQDGGSVTWTGCDTTDQNTCVVTVQTLGDPREVTAQLTKRVTPTPSTLAPTKNAGG